jgi:hypothetical protein
MESAVKTALEVYECALDYTESFEEDTIFTSTLTYLMGSILKGTAIELSEDRESTFWSFLHHYFAEGHKVWSYVQVEDS